ncbi:MAG: lysophospholipase [Firmicutes bacterium]|nr:lysophospholipase [Bacillota bacterium]
MKKEGSFASTNGKDTVRYTEWLPDDMPVIAVLQIAHGMAEHIERYEDFALWLNRYGIAVAGNDHVGHGRTSDPSDYGYMGEKDGWKTLVNDVEKLNGMLHEEHPEVPVSVMGHSMGSFVVRAWMADHGRNCDRFIIMGTSGSNPALKAGLGLTRMLRKKQGGHAVSKMINGMAFGSYNKRIRNARTAFDWLSVNEENVDRYVADPACGFPFTLAGFEDLFTMLSFVNSREWYEKVPKDHHILLISGLEDPVGSYGRGVAEVCEKLKDAGCSQVSMLLFEEMRHEILNEKQHEAVYKEIRDFLLG